MIEVDYLLPSYLQWSQTQAECLGENGLRNSCAGSLCELLWVVGGRGGKRWRLESTRAGRRRGLTPMVWDYTPEASISGSRVRGLQLTGGEKRARFLRCCQWGGMRNRMCSSPGARRSEATPSNCTHITYNTHKQVGGKHTRKNAHLLPNQDFPSTLVQIFYSRGAIYIIVIAHSSFLLFSEVGWKWL